MNPNQTKGMGFAAGSLPALQQMGLGLAVAVFVDAFVVRTILVPSTMKILGKWNWYLPRWLEWMPHFDFEASSSGEPGSAPTAAVQEEPAS